MLNESNAKNAQCVASICREQKVCAHIPAPVGSGLVPDRKRCRGGIFASNILSVARMIWSKCLERISPPLEGRGRGGVFDPKVILAFFQYDVFCALGLDTVFWRRLLI